MGRPRSLPRRRRSTNWGPSLTTNQTSEGTDHSDTTQGRDQTRSSEILKVVTDSSRGGVFPHVCVLPFVKEGLPFWMTKDKGLGRTTKGPGD